MDSKELPKEPTEPTTGPCGMVYEGIDAAIERSINASGSGVSTWIPVLNDINRPFTAYCVRCSNRSRCHGDNTSTN